MSVAGHASALGGPLNAAIDWLHLVAAAAWLGGLLAVYTLATRVRKVGGSVRSVAVEMLRRHGRLALVAAPLVVLTGLANSPLVLGTSRELVASSYGNLLLVKAALASLALAIGAMNHLLLRGRGRGRLATLVGAELLIAAVAVMAGATMVTIQPSATRQPELTGPSVHPAHFFGEAGPSSVHASVSVPAPGRQSYQVTILDLADGMPRPDVQKVFLTFTPPAEGGLPEERVELEPGEIGGLYAISGAYTPVVGEWGLAVTVRRSGALDESVAFAMAVTEPSPAVIGPPPDTGTGVPAPLAVLWQVLPAGLAGWIPGLIAIAAFVLVGIRFRRLTPLRGLLLVLAAVSVLGAGSGRSSRRRTGPKRPIWPPTKAATTQDPPRPDGSSTSPTAPAATAPTGQATARARRSPGLERSMSPSRACRTPRCRTVSPTGWRARRCRHSRPA